MFSEKELSNKEQRRGKNPELRERKFNLLTKKWNKENVEVESFNKREDTSFSLIYSKQINW